ncbi:unnamed protein product [Camellia sinensis]
MESNISFLIKTLKNDELKLDEENDEKEIDRKKKDELHVKEKDEKGKNDEEEMVGRRRWMKRSLLKEEARVQ